MHHPTPRIDQSRTLPCLAVAITLLASASCTSHTEETRTGQVAQQTVMPTTHHVYVDEFGRFSPMWTYIHDGDQVEWHLFDRGDSIIRAAGWTGPWPMICSGRQAWDPDDPNEFTGPMTVGASGVFAMGPKNAAAVDATWESDQISGVFLRLSWDVIDGGPDWAARRAVDDWPVDSRYDFRVLDAEMDRAVANGKVFSIGIKAGTHGTPDWIFDPVIGGVTPVELMDDRSTKVDSDLCGKPVTLGNPGQQIYRDLYNEMIGVVGEHIRSNNRWYRRLAYVKLSGANSDTHENMLPRKCMPALPVLLVGSRVCLCNPQQWAEAGYAPSGLYGFYEQQAAAIAEAFPGKSMSYMLIQDGFPRVNEDHEYVASPGVELPTGIEQTWTAIRMLQDAHRELLVVQQNGLRTGPAEDYLVDHYPAPVEGQCRYDGVHPVGGPDYDQSGSGCPNPWVLRSGWRTRNRPVAPWSSLTGYQTINQAHGVATPADLELALDNAYQSSDAVFIEIYESLLLTSGSDPLSVLTIADWDELFTLRRRDSCTPELPDPYPLTHRHTFTRTIAGPVGNEIFYYMHGSKCGIDYPAHLGTEVQYGVISIQP